MSLAFNGRAPSAAPRRVKLLATLLPVVVLAGTLVPQMATAAVPGGNGRIAYLTATKDAQLWTINADGTGREAVAPVAADEEGTPAPAVGPAFAPDGRMLALGQFFPGEPGPRFEGGVSIIDSLSGRSERRTSDWAVDPEFAPSGDRVVYAGGGQTEPWATYEFSLATGERRTLPVRGHDPTYTPDGESIVYGDDEGGPPGLFRLDLGDGAVHRLADGYIRTPDVSPDGSVVAFTRLEGMGRGARIYEVGIEGGGERQLTRGTPDQNPDRLDTSPSYSPDGRLIVYAQSDGPNSGLQKMPAAGGESRGIPSTNRAYGPDWGTDAGVHRPAVRARRRQRWKGGGSTVRLRVGAGERVHAQARAWARSRFGKVLLRSATRQIRGGASRALKLRPVSRMHRRRLSKSVRREGRLRVRVAVELTDRGGHRAKRRTTLRLR